MPSLRERQKAMKEKITETIGELENSLDDYITQDKDVNLYNYLKSNQIPAPYVSDIKTWSQKRLDEFTEVVDSKDSQLVEGYSNINNKKVNTRTIYIWPDNPWGRCGNVSITIRRIIPAITWV
jgi:hypothetical protein